jgi:hypothetical protein
MSRRVFKSRQLGCSPLTGADLSGLLDLNNSPAPSDDPPTPDYFFIEKFPKSCDPGIGSLKVPTAPFLAGGGTASSSDFR